MQQQEPAAARLAQASSKPERGHLAYIQRLLGERQLTKRCGAGSGMRAVLAAAGDRAAEHDNGSRAKSLLRQAVTAGIALEVPPRPRNPAPAAAKPSAGQPLSVMGCLTTSKCLPLLTASVDSSCSIVRAEQQHPNGKPGSIFKSGL
jgi:hypothetical protein